MISTIVVEDDPIFRDMLLDLLPKAEIPTKLLDVCSTLRQAKEAILKHNPQLLLLDVELPDGKSTELLEELDENNVGIFEVVFVTAYDKYALSAIKKNAADYIVKPVDSKDLNSALRKVERRLSIYKQLENSDELEKQINGLQEQTQQDNKIMINTSDGAIFIKISDIIRLESESNYTIIYLEHNKKLIASKTLSVFEEILTPHNFYRIHRQWIINITKIKNILNVDGAYSTVLIDGSQIEVSRRKKKDFFEKISINA